MFTQKPDASGKELGQMGEGGRGDESKNGDGTRKERNENEALDATKKTGAV